MFNQPNFFPIGYLPPSLWSAITEVQANVQAPVEIAVASALGALSLAFQDQINVRRPNGIVSPCSLFLITIADSGERKTTCDKLFIEPIRDLEMKSEIAAEGALEQYEADLMTWTFQHKALEQRLLKAQKKEPHNLSALTGEFREHLAKKPQRPIARTLILRDATPEAIAWHLHTKQPSVGLMSDEGGSVINGRAAEQLTTLNVLWDGGDVKINRKESESFTVRNARLTVSLMLQNNTFCAFLKGRGQLARDNGFLARALICKPPSTQGYRSINTIGAAGFPKLEVFQGRLRDLLEQSQAPAKNVEMKTKTLEFSPDAKVLWVEFANHIERNLNPGGMYFSVRDAASKTADNVARMAALFHHFEGRSGDIQSDSVAQAHHICEWYLREFVRIFCPPPQLAQKEVDAMTLDAWLRSHYASNAVNIVKRNFLLQYGPGSLRSKARLDPALGILNQFGKIRPVQEPKSRGWFVELLVYSTPYIPQVQPCAVR